MSHANDQALVRSLCGRIDEALATAVPKDAPVALLGFPTQTNSGDHAIWLGETACLKRTGHRVVHLADRWCFPNRHSGRVLRGATILLHGGGNVGDLYPREQHFREEVLRMFPHNKIVQLPQTICFREPAKLAAAQKAFGEHPDFTLLTRDNASLALAQRSFSCRSELCPDMALALGRLETTPPSQEIVWVLRTDHESGQASPPAEATEGPDWSGHPPGPNWRMRHAGLRAAVSALGVPVRARAPGHGPLAAALRSAFDPLAWQNVRSACRIISSGKVLITDRLHGHVLGLLLGRPQVLLDTRFGKVSGFYETWTRDSKFTRFAESPAQAEELARELAAEWVPRDQGMPG